MKYFRWGIISFLGIWIMAQFFQPERRTDESAPQTDLFLQMDVNDSLKNMLVESCYDCHSNQTDYPWYAYVVPFAQMINRHVREGRKELNFSMWGIYTSQEKVGYLSDICKVLENNEMPLKAYLFLHRKARLNDVQERQICAWSEREGLEIFYAN